jgi:hypothetical protein
MLVALSGLMVRVRVGVYEAPVTVTVAMGSPASGSAGGALGAEAEDREVAEPRLIAETIVDLLPDRLEVHDVDAMTAFAGEIRGLAGSDQGIEAGTVADVDMVDRPELLELLERPIDRGHVRPRAAAPEPRGDVLGRYGALRIEERLEHEPTVGR